MPVYAALAEEDRVVDTPAAARWLDGVQGLKIVRILPDVAHALPLENGWQALTDDVMVFVGPHTVLRHQVEG